MVPQVSPPEITLSTTTSEIEEGQTATIRFTSNQVASTNGLVANYSKSQVGNFFATSFAGTDSVTILVGETTKGVNFVTHDDNVDEADGSFTISLASGTGYSLGSDSSITVNVADNDALPVFSITPVEASVFESIPAQFRLTTPSTSSTPTLVRVDISQTYEVLSGVPGIITIVVPASTSEMIFDIETEYDLVYESDGIITATLLVDDNSLATYSIDAETANQSAEVTIKNDDALPAYSISPVTDSVVEPNLVQFKVTSPTSLPNRIFILYSLSHTGNVISTGHGHFAGETLYMPAYATETILSIYTEDDEVYETNGVVTATLQPFSGWYNLSPISENRSAEVTVIDDDELQGTTPVVTIYSSDSDVTEGENFEVTFTLDQVAPLGGLNVNYRVASLGQVFFNDISYQTRTFSIVIPAGEKTFVKTFRTIDNEIDRRGSEHIEVSLVSGSGYLLGSTSSVENLIWVRDNDEEPSSSSRSLLPLITLSTSTPDVVEGETSIITFESDQIAPAGGIQVSYGLIQTGNFVSLNTSNQIFDAIIPEGSRFVDVSHSTHDDFVDEPNGNFTIYFLGTISFRYGTEGYLTVNVADNDEPPILEIASSNTSLTVIEGESVEVTISSDQVAPANGILVNFQKSQTGNFFANNFTGNDSKRILVGRNSANLKFETQDDQFDEQDGNVTISLVEGDGYTIGTNGSVTFNVLDNDKDSSLPVFSIAPIVSTVVESDPAQFVLTSPRVSSSPISLRIKVSQTGNVLGSASGERSITIDAGIQKKIIELVTEDDVVDEVDGTITVTLISDAKSIASYLISTNTSEQSAEVVVTDDDTLPTYSITSVTPSVVESNLAQFRVSSPTASASEVIVRIKVSQTGNVIADTLGDTTTTMAAFATEKVIDFATEDDVVDEPNGTITVTLLADDSAITTYTISTDTNNQSAQVAITDDDSLPVYSIASVATSVVESYPAQYRLTSPTASSSPVIVRVTISQTGNVLSDIAGNTTTTVAALTTEKIINIATEDDEVDELDGTISVSLLDDDNTPATYTITTELANQSAEIKVRDNDELEITPVITLSAAETSINEGEIVSIMISSDQVISSKDLLVNYSITEVGSNLDAFYAGTHQAFVPAGQDSVELKLQTSNDYIHEPDGRINFALIGDSSYEIGTASSVTVAVNDSSYRPRMSIVDARAVYNESGAIAEFYLQSTNAFVGTKTINVSVTGLTKTVEWRQVPSTVIMDGTGDKTSVNSRYPRAILQVPIHNDQIREQVGQIAVTILPSTNAGEYEVSSFHDTRQLSISSFDLPHSSPLPVVSVSSSTRQLFGEETHIIKLSLSRAVDTPLIVNYLSKFSYAFVSFYRSNYSVENRTVTIPAGITERVLVYRGIQTTPIYRAGKFELTILSGPDYVVAPSPDNYAKFDLRNQNKPTGVSISSQEYSIEHYNYVDFIISASTLSESDRVINVDVSDGTSEFLFFSGSSKIVLPAGEFQTTFRVFIEDDDVDEPDGFVTGTILPGTGYTVATTENSIAVRIYDNDGPPVVSFDKRRYWFDEWREGFTGRLYLDKTSSIPDGTIINFRVRDGGDNIYDGAEYRTIRWYDFNPIFHTFNSLEIVTRENEIVGENSPITVELLPGEGYDVASTNGTVTITVIDDDDATEVVEEPNIISVQALESTITEGQYAQFVIKASVPRNYPYQVQFRYSEGDGNFIDEITASGYNPSWSQQGHVHFHSGETYKSIVISTLDDNVHESDGAVTLTFNRRSSNAYSLPNNVSSIIASVTVLDNDEVSMPLLTIVPVAVSVTESNVAQFRITSSSANNTPMTIRYNVSQFGNVLNDETGDFTTIFAANQTEKIIEIATQADIIDEPDGEITVRLLEDESSPKTYDLFTITANRTAEVTVIDDDALPIFSITPVNSSVVESNLAQFRLTSPTASTSPVTVRFNVSQTGNFLVESTGDATTTIDALATEGIIDIATENDLIDEPDGTISVSLLDDDKTTATYRIATNSAEHTAEVLVTDDDAIPTFAIASVTDFVEESNRAQFRLTSETTSSLPITVRINVTQSGKCT